MRVRVVAHTHLILKLMTDNHISQSALLLEKKYAYDKSLSALRFHPWFPNKYNYVIQLYWRKEKQALHAFYTHPCHRLFPVFVFLFVILSLETNMSLTVGSDVSHTILICKHCADTHILVLMS